MPYNNPPLGVRGVWGFIKPENQMHKGRLGRRW